MKVKLGVILAAGKGSRILPLSNHTPKPMLLIDDKPIMQYQIEVMKKSGINQIVIVIGHLGHKIKKHFGRGSKFGVKIRYIEDQTPKGIASSLLKAEKFLKQPFVLFLGDIFISKIDLKAVIDKFTKFQTDSVIVVVKEKSFEAVKRNFSVIVKKNDQITQVIEKPQNPSNLLKGIGVYVFTSAIFQAIRNTPASELRGEVELTDSIQTLINQKKLVYIQVQKLWEVNITTVEDLVNCNLRFLKNERI